ncbi:MAG: PQQ-binding-like beta-propeller repeat protein [Candidatus Altiarchaeota archaeon]
MRSAPYLAILLILAQNAAAADWPTFRGNFLRTGESDAETWCNMSDFGALWDYQTGGQVESSPVISDIDMDGIKEIVFGSADGYVYALDYQGEVEWRFKTGGPVRSSPTAADVFKDQKTEILIGSDDGRLYLLDSRGRHIWNFSTGGPVRSSPALIETDPQSDNKIVFGSEDGRIYALNSKGVEDWSYKTLDKIDSSPAIYDIDIDGKDEIIIGSADNIIYVLKYPPYKVWQYLTKGDISATPTIDESGRIIVGSEDGVIYRLEIQWMGTAETRRVRVDDVWGTDTISLSGLGLLWNHTIDSPIRSSTAVGDVFPEGGYGLAVGAGDKNLHFVNSDGTDNRTYTLSKPIESSPALADLDGDGTIEVIFGSNEGSFYIVDYPGVRRFSHDTGSAVRSSPAVADLTGDGSPEIAIGSDNGKVYLFGDRRGRSIGVGDALYLKALEQKGVGNFAEAIPLINQAREIYAKVKYIRGIDKCDDLLESIDSDRILQDAQRLYEQGDFEDAGQQLQRAAETYRQVNDTGGMDRSDILFRRIEAEKYYLEGKYYFDSGLHSNASVYIEAAKTFFRSLNDTEGIIKCQNLTVITKNQDNAQTYYEDGMSALKEGRLDTAKMLLGFAKKSFELAGRTEDMAKIDRTVDTIKGDESYAAAAAALNRSSFENATENAKEAMKWFENTSAEGFEKSLKLYQKANNMYEANMLYNDAELYWRGAYFKKAAEYAENASRKFNESGDYAGYAKARKIIDNSNKAQTPTTSSSGWMNSTVVVTIALLILAAAIILKKQPSTVSMQYKQMPQGQYRPIPPGQLPPRMPGQPQRPPMPQPGYKPQPPGKFPMPQMQRPLTQPVARPATTQSGPMRPMQPKPQTTQPMQQTPPQQPKPQTIPPKAPQTIPQQPKQQTTQPMQQTPPQQPKPQTIPPKAPQTIPQQPKPQIPQPSAGSGKKGIRHRITLIPKDEKKPQEPVKTPPQEPPAQTTKPPQAAEPNQPKTPSPAEKLMLNITSFVKKKTKPS